MSEELIRAIEADAAAFEAKIGHKPERIKSKVHPCGWLYGWRDTHDAFREFCKSRATPSTIPASEGELPPLPAPSPTHYREVGLSIERMEMFTADQMLDYARAALASTRTASDTRTAAGEAECDAALGRAAPAGQHDASTAMPEQQPSGAVYGIIDPDYGRIYTMVRKLAWEEGYAIGLHGSFTRDLDMIAVPWADQSNHKPEKLVARIIQATGLQEAHGNPGEKPHGRKVWTLLLPEFGDPRFVDLSIMPAAAGPARQGGDTQNNSNSVSSPTAEQAGDAEDAARWRAFRSRDEFDNLDFDRFKDQFREDADRIVDAAIAITKKGE